MQKIKILGFLILATIFILAKAISAEESDSDALKTARRNLMPVPATVVWKTGKLTVSKNFV